LQVKERVEGVAALLLLGALLLPLPLLLQMYPPPLSQSSLPPVLTATVLLYVSPSRQIRPPLMIRAVVGRVLLLLMLLMLLLMLLMLRMAE
jgi:hypothetical protein